MNHSDEELKARVADRRIKALALDTSIFDTLKNGFENGLLARLAQFRDTDVQVLISDVIAGEVRRHIIRDASAADAALKTVLKTVGTARGFSRETRSTLAAQLIGEEAPQLMAARRLTAFQQSVGAEIVESGARVDTRRLLNDYFAAAPPFGETAAKKSEFPDAIALQALEHWAIANNTEVLAVSGDGDWLKFCSASPNLVCIADLGTALELFHQDATLARVRIARRLASGEINVDEALSDAIKWAADSIDFLADGDAGYRFEAEISGVEVLESALKLDEDNLPRLTVVDGDHEMITLEGEAVVTLSVTADFSFSTTDPVDKDEMRIGSCSVSRQLERTANVLLTFELADDGEASLSEIEATFEKGTDWIEYGAVEPDWGDDEF